jgi:hypothetical protein
MKERILDTLFKNTANIPHGDCPLPEPGRGAPTIESVQHIDVGKQPPRYDYDFKINEDEAARYEKVLKEASKEGLISKKETKQLLKLK